MPSINKVVNKGRQLSQKGTPSTLNGDVLSRIRNLGFDRDEGIKLLLYGRSGTGKTTLWATFPGPILAIICSGGTRPGELRSIDTPEYRKKVNQVVLENSSEMATLTAYLKNNTNYRTVVLDHCSGFQDQVLKEILGLTEIPVQKSWGMASQQQYGQCVTQCKQHLRALLDLDQHVVIVAQERASKEDGSESEHLMPTVGAGLMPSLAGWLNPAADYICQTLIRQKEEEIELSIGEGKSKTVMTEKRKVKGQVEYCLRTAPDPVYTTKFRLPRGRVLPEFIVDPTFQKLMNLIKPD